MTDIEKIAHDLQRLADQMYTNLFLTDSSAVLGYIKTITEIRICVLTLPVAQPPALPAPAPAPPVVNKPSRFHGVSGRVRWNGGVLEQQCYAAVDEDGNHLPIVESRWFPVEVVECAAKA